MNRASLMSRGVQSGVVATLVVAASILAANVANENRGVHDRGIPAGSSGLPGPRTVHGAIRELAERLHRVPALALIRLEPGTVTFQYYAKGRSDRGSFISWRDGRFGTPRPFSFPDHANAPELRFDPAELNLDGVSEADRLRSDIGLGDWELVRAEALRRGAPISDGSGLVWRITVDRTGKQLALFTNQAGRFLRIARIPGMSPAATAAKPGQGKGTPSQSWKDILDSILFGFAAEKPEQPVPDCGSEQQSGISAVFGHRRTSEAAQRLAAHLLALGYEGLAVERRGCNDFAVVLNGLRSLKQARDFRAETARVNLPVRIECRSQPAQGELAAVFGHRRTESAALRLRAKAERFGFRELKVLQDRCNDWEVALYGLQTTQQRREFSQEARNVGFHIVYEPG